MPNGNALKQIDTIVIVMLENRSFDHMLSHLSYNGINHVVDGLRAPLDNPLYANVFEGEAYPPFIMRDGQLPCDVPHERKFVTRQLAYHQVTNRYAMNGFVDAYYNFTTVNRTQHPEAMGFLHRSQVPITSFLAQHFSVCDRWFAPIPTSTLPNRLMFLTGTTLVDSTGGAFPPRAGTFILDWLSQHGVPWRVYHAGVFSFFWLLGKWDVVLGNDCREFARFASDVATEPDNTFPKVILIEPSYGDAPRFGPPPNDNHAPGPVAPGEIFLHAIYSALVLNPARWAKTLLIVTYDEHGGCFDHVPPLEVRMAPGGGAQFTEPFATTGPRVPAIVVSPLAVAGSVCHAAFDHTSILQLLAERFGAGATDYSADVTARRNQGIRSLSDALTGPADPRRPTPPAPPSPPGIPAGPYDRPSVFTPPAPRGSPTSLHTAFLTAATQAIDQFTAQAEAKFPGITAWRTAL